MAESQPVNISADKFAEAKKIVKLFVNLAIALIYQMKKMMSNLKMKMRLLYLV